MNRKPRRQAKKWNQRGTIAVLTAAGLLVLLGITGLAVDLGHLYVVKSELQRAADAGAMAGARALYPFPLSNATLPISPDCGAAQAQGRTICQANLVEGDSASVAQIQTGSWNWPGSLFSPGCSTSPFSNAVTLTTRRDSIPLTVMGALGLGPVGLQATGVAVMDWVGNLEKGAASVLAIGKKYAQKGDVYIYLNPDPIDGGGWYTKAPEKPNASTLKGYLDNPGNVPAIKQGDMVNLDNGAVSSVLSKLASWIGKTMLVPVVDTEKFNQSAPVEGFTAFTITEVNTKGHKYIRGTALPLADASEKLSDPGGANFGLLSAPRVVK